ncbi:thioester-containing protein 1 allele R1-like isoform X2 [Bombus huntii]|uniref:thioester-containing protein 1 allele R1-like isoform X2 n=1 Tax=Bombus huntii TaxID=85661 RepID=UPI0021A99634|nr:thioester-containing protein 1 allele R1-like isoform X2 [Bombus huntii]
MQTNQMIVILRWLASYSHNGKNVTDIYRRSEVARRKGNLHLLACFLRTMIVTIKMDWQWFNIVILFYLILNVTAEQYYSIIAPKVIRPDSEYHVAVSITGVSIPSVIYIELSGSFDNNSRIGEVFNISQVTHVQPYSTRILRFEIDDIIPGKYELIARGLTGIEFSQSKSIEFIPKSYSVFIQTDRAIYKPGNKVMFRCILLDSRLRPTLERLVNIYIVDGKGNRIKQWNHPSVTHGIFNAEIELSEYPVLGTWKITANIGDQTFEKDFEVAEYVLPNFEVIIDAPKHFTFKESKITATIYAKYTYGKPVKGEATVTAYPDIFSDVIQPIYQQPIRKVIPINGKIVVDFDIHDELRLTDEYERPVMLDVTVEESLTGRRQNTSAHITLHKHKYTMDLIKTSEYYKPGLKYTAFIKLTYHDGTPVRDNKNFVMVKYGYTYITDNQSTYTNITGMLDENGMVKLDFYPPKTNDNMSYPLNIEAQYLNLHEWFPSTNQAMSQNNEYIQAVLKTEKPMVNRDVEIEVNSTALLKYINYEIFGRGDILDAGSIYVQNKHTTSFKFLATYVMAPTAHVIIYYIGNDGEIIADALDVELEGLLQNFVDIKMASEEVAPGDDINLVITSKPNSYVGLLGVDQRSILLKSGNDISYEQVYKELKSYDNNHESPYANSVFDRYLWNPGSATAKDVFRESGAIIITNAYVHENFQILYYRSGVEFAFPTAAGSFSSIALPSEKTKVRKNFPETWLWQTLDAGYEGKNELKRNVPDSITSWVLTAFSVNDVHGLGLMEEPRKLKVFRPFFISMEFPYSVIRGEIVAIQIVVFNYMNKNVVAEVLLTNEGQFDFAEMSNEVQDVPKLELYRKKKVEVKANSGSSVSFMIVPRDLGYITIKATANSILAGDSVERKLLVKAEGETQYVNRATFIDLRSTTNTSMNITIDIPKNAVPGSEYIEISAVGDILGPSIMNLANLIKLPSGCGEQNMLNFVPNIMILNYLKNTNQLTHAVESKALRYMEIGYQRELTYRHNDGSFSAFGMSDSNGSTWLTAFVAKAFKQAAAYIPIEDRIIDEALQWLSNNQAPNGSFPEVGRISHRDMQGGAAKGLALTAFTLITFLENSDSNGKYRNTINKGIDYIVRNMNDLNDTYALSICTYALNLAKHPYETAAFNLLESKAMTKEDIKWWSKPIPANDKNPWYHSLPRSVDVEMTSYTLLTYIRRNLVADSIPIMKWLVKQRNAEGGFASTQDTVIGIQALAKLGEKLVTKTNVISIIFLYEGGGQSQMNINPNNSMILQKQMLPKKTRLIGITATGNGFALVQITYKYNLNVTGAWPLFTLDPQVDKNSNANHLQLSICSGFVPTKEANESNMVVMEVSLPSGFTVDKESLPSLEVSQNVKRVETKNGDTVVILYFDEMSRQEYCPTVSAFRTHKVAKQKPVPVTIYDYYDSSRRARVFYEPRKATLCDICEDEDCEDLCVLQPGKQKDSPQSAASHLSTCTYLHLLFTSFYITYFGYL